MGRWGAGSVVFGVKVNERWMLNLGFEYRSGSVLFICSWIAEVLNCIFYRLTPWLDVFE